MEDEIGREAIDGQAILECENPHVCRRQRPSLQAIMRLDHAFGV